MEIVEKRAEGRFLCAELVRFDWVVGENILRTEQALLEDISALGGCVQLDEPLPLGAIVMLTVGRSPFYGYVNYCTFRDDAYFIGVRFSDDTVWSASIVEPQHLTNLQHLGELAQARA